MSEKNFSLTGDEARLLMASLIQTTVSAPAGPTVQLYIRLNEISQVQPATTTKES